MTIDASESSDRGWTLCCRTQYVLIEKTFKTLPGSVIVCVATLHSNTCGNRLYSHSCGLYLQIESNNLLAWVQIQKLKKRLGRLCAADVIFSTDLFTLAFYHLLLAQQRLVGLSELDSTAFGLYMWV